MSEKPLLAVEIEEAPTAYLVVGQATRIVALNRVARQIGIEGGTRLTQYVAEDDVEKLLSALESQETISTHMLFAQSEKHVMLCVIKKDAEVGVWLTDMTALGAMAEKVHGLKNPQTKQIRQVHQHMVSALSYVELLDVILDEEDSLSSEKLISVKQYQRNVLNHLKIMQRTLSGEPVSTQERGKSQILVVEMHKDLADLIVELLKSEGYKVTGFTDSTSALEFCAVNSHTIVKVIVDETLVLDDGQRLATALENALPRASIFTLTTDAQNSAVGLIQKPIDFQALIDAMDD